MEARGTERNIRTERISPEDRDQITRYLQFEVDQGFTKINPNTTFEKMVDFRSRQLREGKLQVAIASEGDDLVATSVVVLENGTMGRDIEKDEAWAGGTVVREGMRGKGIGETMAAEQEAICREAGKNSILTVIDHDNYPSMRLRMKVGYELEGINDNDRVVSYRYRKVLHDNLGDPADRTKLNIGDLSLYDGEINEKSPNEILLAPGDVERVRLALENNYRGKQLIRPEDSTDSERRIEKNLVIFVR